MDHELLNRLREELHLRGFVRIPKSVFSLDADQVKDLRHSFELLFDGRYETGIYPDEIHWRKGISKENATRELCNCWKSSPRVAEHVCSQELGKLACSLMGWPSSRVGQDDVLQKTPQSGPVGFHQDGAYISTNFSPPDDNSLTMWVALDDADSENGALQYAPGSHLWGKEQQQQTKSPADGETSKDMSSLSFHVGEGQDYLTSLRQAAAKAGVDPAEAVASIETVPVKTGEMVVHHQDVWHGSGPNTSTDRHRRAMVAHLLNGEVRWSSTHPKYIYGRYYIRGETIPREDFFPYTYRGHTD